VHRGAEDRAKRLLAEALSAWSWRAELSAQLEYLMIQLKYLANQGYIVCKAMALRRHALETTIWGEETVRLSKILTGKKSTSAHKKLWLEVSRVDEATRKTICRIYMER
jgi:hypothetical protein